MRAVTLDRMITLRTRGPLTGRDARGTAIFAKSVDRKVWAARVQESAQNDLEQESARLSSEDARRYIVRLESVRGLRDRDVVISEHGETGYIQGASEIPGRRYAELRVNFRRESADSRRLL